MSSRPAGPSRGGVGASPGEEADTTESSLECQLDQAIVRLSSGDGRVHRRFIVAETPVDVRAIREHLGMSQNEFAITFGLSIGAVRNWEQRLRKPDQGTRKYLMVIKHEPEAALRAQEKERRSLIQDHHRVRT